jgi:hypothetical protein
MTTVFNIGAITKPKNRKQGDCYPCHMSGTVAPRMKGGKEGSCCEKHLTHFIYITLQCREGSRWGTEEQDRLLMINSLNMIYLTIIIPPKGGKSFGS